ncbi:MAG: Cu(I)-responsive transcriptional regulator [Pseudomonadota bacterium]
MNISETAAQAGLPAKTIRYYEDIGLVAPSRDANGYRRFSESEVHQLTFLARARSLGFTIEDCRKLLDLYSNTARASADVKTLASEHLARIGDKITELEAMRNTLTTLVDHCHGDQRPECPILDGLARP